MRAGESEDDVEELAESGEGLVEGNAEETTPAPIREINGQLSWLDYGG